jgi:hypothetical protein
MSLRDLVTESAGTDSGERVRCRFRRYYRLFHFPLQFERELWVLAIGAILADVTLTMYGLQLGLEERNPVARAALDHAGVSGLSGLKALALLAGVCCRPLVPDGSNAIIPLAIAIPSVTAAIINAVLIGLVVF